MKILLLFALLLGLSSCGTRPITGDRNPASVDDEDSAELEQANRYQQLFDFEGVSTPFFLLTEESIFDGQAGAQLTRVWNETYAEVSAGIDQQLETKGEYAAYQDYLLRDQDVALIKKHTAYQVLAERLTPEFLDASYFPARFSERFADAIEAEDHAVAFRRSIYLHDKGNITYSIQYSDLLSNGDKETFAAALKSAVDDWNTYLPIRFKAARSKESDFTITFEGFGDNYSTDHSLQPGEKCTHLDSVNYAYATVFFDLDNSNRIEIFPPFFDPHNKFNRAGIMRHELGHILGLLHTCHNPDAPREINCGIYQSETGAPFLGYSGQPYSRNSVMKDITECCTYGDFELAIDPEYDGDYVYGLFSGR